MLLITFSIIAGIGIIILMGGLITQRFVTTPRFKDDQGKVIRGSIAEFRRVKINGDHHAILIRGKNLNNPMLLFLHAGPCLSETGMMRNYNSKLEENFTMVYYDMRGSAKSFSLLQNYEESFTTENLLHDIHEMTLYLKKSSKTEKIILAGHSFGAGFGAMAASRYPDDYSAYIGIGQPTNPTEINRISYSWVLATAEKDSNHKAILELKQADKYWESDDQESYFRKMMVHKKWIGHYGGQLVGKTGFVSFVLRNMTCKEYNIFDYFPYLMGMMAGGPASFDIMKSADLEKQAHDFRQPVFFITGTQDYNVVPDLVKQYYDSIHAPVKKMYWFEHSAHFPHIEEPELFQKILIDDILPLILAQASKK